MCEGVVIPALSMTMSRFVSILLELDDTLMMLIFEKLIVKGVNVDVSR